MAVVIATPKSWLLLAPHRLPVAAKSLCVSFETSKTPRFHGYSQTYVLDYLSVESNLSFFFCPRMN
jgi:hypothetical protein